MEYIRKGRIMSELVVFAFENESGATEMRDALVGLQKHRNVNDGSTII